MQYLVMGLLVVALGLTVAGCQWFDREEPARVEPGGGEAQPDGHRADRRDLPPRPGPQPVAPVQQYNCEAVTAVVSPSSPSADQAVSVTVTGTWRNTCVPDRTSHEIEGNEVRIHIYDPHGPDTMCGQALTDWSLTERIGQLEPGRYTVLVSLQKNTATGADEKYEQAVPPTEQATFEVAAE